MNNATKARQAEILERVRLSKQRLARSGDPLGIRNGEYAKRPKQRIGDLTPERAAKLGDYVWELSPARPWGD